MHSCGSFVRQARLQFAGLHSLFLAWGCIVIEIGGMMKDLLFWNWCIYILGLFAVADAFLTTDVSALPWYSLLQMLFFRPMYLQLALLWTCRCFSVCLACTIASASCLFWDLKILPLQILHLHPTFSITWRCSPVKLRIFNLLFQCFADAPHQNFASSIP